MAKMRIAYISHNFYPIKRISGSINFSYNQCKALGELCELHVINPNTSGFPRIERHKGYTIHRVARPFTINAARKAASLHPDVTILRSGIVDLPLLVPQVILVKIFLGKGKLLLYQKTEMAKQSAALFKLADRCLEKVICSSTAMQRFFAQASRKTVFIAPGINLAETRNVKPAAKGKRIRIGYIGHLFYSKGPDLAIRAFDSLDLPDAELLIAGYGGLEPKLRKMANETGKPGRILFLPFQKDLYPLIASCDLLLFPFRKSKNILGTALTAIEAAGLGKPIIGSEADALADLIEDGKTGLIFRSEQQLQQQMRLLATNPGLRRLLGKNARSAVEKRFDINLTAREVLHQCQKAAQQ